MSDVIWSGVIEGNNYRIVAAEENDCFVEQELPNGTSEATDDETAARVYMIAFLEERKKTEVRIPRPAPRESPLPCFARGCNCWPSK